MTTPNPDEQTTTARPAASADLPKDNPTMRINVPPREGDERVERAIAAALDLAKEGFGITEVYPPNGVGCTCPKGAACLTPGKHPVGDEWQQRLTQSPHTVKARIVKRHGQYGVVPMPGRRGLICDIDKPWAWPAGVEVPDTFTVETSTVEHEGQTHQKRHVYALLPEGFDASSLPAVTPWGEVRVEGASRHVVGPWSRHHSGSVYTPNDRPIMEVDADWLAAVFPVRQQAEEPIFTNAGNYTLPESWSGSWYEAVLPHVGHLRCSRGLTKDEAWAEVHRVWPSILTNWATRTDFGTEGHSNEEALRLKFDRIWDDDERDPESRRMYAEAVRRRREREADVVTEADGLWTVARLGDKALRVRSTTGSRIHVEARIGDTDPIISGTHDIGTVSGKRSLARSIADAEGPKADHQPWLRLIQAVGKAADAARPTLWRHGLSLRDDDRIGFRPSLHPYIAPGKDVALFGHLGRYKTQVSLAMDISLLTGTSIIPGTYVHQQADHIISINYEADPGTLIGHARAICLGAGIDPDVLDGRIHFLAGGVPPLTALADEVLEMMSTFDEDEPYVHIDLDSAQRAIGSADAGGSGDVWNDSAQRLYRTFADIRRVSGLPDTSSLVIDHAGGERARQFDTEATFSELRTYGSRGKDQIARAVWRIGKFEPDEEYEGTGLVRLGEAKAWDNYHSIEDVWFRLRWTDEGTLIEGATGTDAVSRYPQGIKEGRAAALIYDIFVANAKEVERPDGSTVTQWPVFTVHDLVRMTKKPSSTVDDAIHKHSVFVRSTVVQDQDGGGSGQGWTVDGKRI